MVYFIYYQLLKSHFEYLEHDVVEVGGDVGCADHVLGLEVAVLRVERRGGQRGVLQVLAVAQRRGRGEGVLAHRQDVALLVDRANHTRHRLRLILLHGHTKIFNNHKIF